MSRRVSATPCPIGGSQTFSFRRESIFSVDNDTTSNLEFTTDFRGSLYNTKPKRRKAGIKNVDTGLEFTIHEDVEDEQPSKSEQNTASVCASTAAGKRKSIMQPPQKPKHRVSFVPTDLNRDVRSDQHLNLSSSLYQAPRRPTQKQPAQMTVPEDASLSHFPQLKLSKPARRGTIYIPSDDTTMPSMYMGIFSPIKDMTQPQSVQSREADDDMTGIAAQMVKRRKQRISILAASPKRGPLLPAAKVTQLSTTVEDKIGDGNGKENIPPSCKTSGLARPPRKSLMPHNLSKVAIVPEDTNIKTRPKSSLYAATASSAARTKPLEPTSRKIKPQWNAGARRASFQPISSKIRQSSPPPTLDLPKVEPVNTSTFRVPSRFVIPNLKQDVISCLYPLLSENLEDPSMYEENWLTHQEIAITQLINSLYQASNPTSIEEAEPTSLRLRLLHLYSDTDMKMLYKRLYGALSYGSLKVSQDYLDRASRLDSDLGRRKAFTDLWLDNYEHHPLQAALETVVGRLCVDEIDPSASRRSSGNVIRRRMIQRFIETFLIRNEDGKPEKTEESRVSWSYQRTLLRSLMLIKLLDLTKTTSNNATSASLFQTTSTYKSSSAIVQAVIRMLNPSAGDPTRVLGHINYAVNHVQYPLEEYDYRIQNLATDLRDGVCLTRLVELLLYPSASESLPFGRDEEATTTILMPTGEILSLVEGQRSWPLSQHVKFPCLGRATKLYNTQIALSALQTVRGFEMTLQDIKAEDIVDGYREKTVKLLWSLTSKWGLSGLADWEDVKREIKRLSRAQGQVGFNEEDIENILDDEDEDHAKYKKLLKLWARAVARSRGVVIKNFTTSFSDGRVFESIVVEYEQYFPRIHNRLVNRDLHERLLYLGCSKQFSQLFAPLGSTTIPGRIFDRDFVLASLAFLCSRLLGPTRIARAATTIQRAWKVHWSRIEDSRKKQLRKVAEACADIVQSKEKVLIAKATIWNAWTSYQRRKSSGDIHRALYQQRMIKHTEREDEDIWLSL